MDDLLKQAVVLYGLDGYECAAIPGHQGGRNLVFACKKDGENRYILRVSLLGDRPEEDYLAETEFVHWLAQNGAPVADVIPSVNGNLVERASDGNRKGFVSLFAWAKGILLSDNGYRYREGAPLSEYFRNTGKTLGTIHRLSKIYRPAHRRISFSDKYNMDYLDRLIPDEYTELKQAVFRRLEQYRQLPRDGESFGLVHFDFSDGNYHVDLDTGKLTAFDFDNCIYCWYMFDLAHLWTHGVGWYQHVQDPVKRMEGMAQYFSAVLEGYRSETEVSDELLTQLPLFIDMTLIEYVVDAFECSARGESEELEEDYFRNMANCLIHDIPYAGVGEKWP